jgi:hypothetical protein
MHVLVEDFKEPALFIYTPEKKCIPFGEELNIGLLIKGLSLYGLLLDDYRTVKVRGGPLDGFLKQHKQQEKFTLTAQEKI